MKYFTYMLASLILLSCNKHSTLVQTDESRIPFDEVVKILREHLPEDASKKVATDTLREDLFDLVLTEKEFYRLMHDFPNEIKNHSRNNYSYDLHHAQATTFDDGFSSFSISIGRGKDYHYIITGSFVSDEGPGKSLIWIKPTQG